MPKLKLNPDDITFAFDLPPEKAIAYFERKGFAITWDWKEQLNVAHDTAFTVAKAMNAEVLQSIKDELDKSIKGGTTFRDFKKNLEPRLSELGWTGKRYETNPNTGQTELVELGTPKRLENIFRTNVMSSYNRGRFEQQLETVDTRPYGILRVVSDNRTTSYCRSIKDTVFRLDDPEMQRIYPPNHFRCRDRVQTLNEAQLKRRGFEVADAKEFFKNKANIPNEGFDKAPNVQWKPDASKYDKAIGKELTSALATKAKSETATKQPQFDLDENQMPILPKGGLKSLDEVNEFLRLRHVAESQSPFKPNSARVQELREVWAERFGITIPKGYVADEPEEPKPQPKKDDEIIGPDGITRTIKTVFYDKFGSYRSANSKKGEIEFNEPLKRLGLRAETEKYLFGKTLTDDDYHAFVGHAKGSLRVDILDSNTIFIVRNNDGVITHYSATISTELDDKYKSKPVFKLDLMILDKSQQGKGLGTELTANTVEACRKIGIDKIKLDASSQDGMNGFYTWPRLGFDGKIPIRIKRTLPKEFAGAENISDLMATPEGVRYWKENGSTLECEFDTRKGSYSSNVLAAMVKRNAEKKK